MSLINDALKRAKAAQQQTPPPPVNLPFRPVEPAPVYIRRGLGLAMPVTLTIVACLALLLLWQWAQLRNAGDPLEATARTAPIPEAAAAPLPASAAIPQPEAAPLPEAPPPPVQATPETAPALPAAAEPAPAPAALAVAAAPEAQPAEAEPAVAPALPKPPPLRLQAIIFDPRRPSAMINGKLVFLGDKVRDFRVARIDQESATLVGGGLTNVLTLLE